jgi:ficolin
LCPKKLKPIENYLFGNITFHGDLFFHLKGDAGDALAWHNQMQFTTKDSDNDGDSLGNCAVVHKGAWWYNGCYYSNLNGLYLGAGKISHTGTQWNRWHYYSMKKTEMKIRPSQF